MGKRKKRMLIALAVLAALIGLASWYLFLGRKITDATREVISGQENTRALCTFGYKLMNKWRLPKELRYLYNKK